MAIPNPGVTPPDKVSEPTQKPVTGVGEEGQEPQPFSLPPEPAGTRPPSEEIAAGRPSPMDVAGAVAKQQKVTPEQVTDKLNVLNEKFDTAIQKVKDPKVNQKFTDDHYDAFNKIFNGLGRDMRSIAKYSNSQFKPPSPPPAGSPGAQILKFLVDYLNSGQQTSQNAISFLSRQTNPNIGQLLSLQFSVQRATQKVELVSSVTGSAVSGIKSLMGMQLG